MVNPAALRSKTRVRRTVDEARRLILEAAQRRLAEGGLDAVRVQTVAADVGVTDAAVHYHFGSRQGLLDAVVRSAGRRLRNGLQAVIAGWDPGTLDIAALADQLRLTMESEGQARLTAWMALGGWKPQGAGMLRPLAEAMQEQLCEAAKAVGQPPPPIEDTLFAVELLGLVVWAESLSGDAWRRSVGLKSDRATADRFMEWVAALVEDRLRTGDSRSTRE
jgi:TetR/AcrR family transcriptional regulator, repressor for neighboring sulfatase